MQLYEFQAKAILQKNGIRVPNGRIARTPEEAAEFAKEIGMPVAIKAQVLSGGRGLAGAIKFSQDVADISSIASSILKLTVKSEKPTALLIEEKMNIARELYCSVTWEYQRKCPILIASSRGGMDIETIARDHPHEVAQLQIDPYLGYSQYMGRQLATMIGLKGGEVTKFANFVNLLWRIFNEHDAELVEVNPLGFLSGGNLIAIDAKITLDDKSLFRQSDLIKQIQTLPIDSKDGLTYRRLHAKELGIPTYIEMEGDMGIVTDGAGSGMLTLDLVKDAGGRARTYCELGGEATAELLEKTLMTVMNSGNIRVILVNLIGGLNRMDEMAEGIVGYVTKQTNKPPIVVRMAGTREDEGRQILSANGVTYYDDLYEAVKEAVVFKR
jgi:succinyl-CoA synthetase beta subunit